MVYDSFENIIIHEIQLYSESVKINNDYSTKLYQDIDMFDAVEDVLLKQYSHNSIQVSPKEIIVRTKDSVSIYVPLSFLDDIHFIHRACIYIVYEKNGEMKRISIDDFPFINTSIFQIEYEDHFRYYEYSN